MNEVLAHLRSAIQSRMRFLDLYAANFDELRLIIDVLFLAMHAMSVGNSPPKYLHSSLSCIVYFNLFYSDYDFFDFESVDTVHTDGRRCSHFTFG